MSITGRVNLVNNPTAFFAPIILGTGAPTSGFVPAKSSGVVVAMNWWMQPIPSVPAMPLALGATVSAVDGNFTLPDIPAPFLPLVNEVSINVAVHGRPFYRSDRFPRSHTNKHLDIFVFQPSIPSTDGVTAGLISTGLAGQGLPENTALTANSWGVNVVGSRSGVDVQFGIRARSGHITQSFHLLRPGY